RHLDYEYVHQLSDVARSSRAAASTCAGSSRLRQSRCCKGHSRLKQGLQGRSRDNSFARVPSGGVNAAEVEPYGTTSGRPRLAATCIRPESLLTTSAHSPSRSTASPRLVAPQRL